MIMGVIRTDSGSQLNRTTAIKLEANPLPILLGQRGKVYQTPFSKTNFII